MLISNNKTNNQNKISAISINAVAMRPKPNIAAINDITRRTIIHLSIILTPDYIILQLLYADKRDPWINIAFFTS